MTFKEKLKQDYPMLEVENATQNSCPCDYEYEEKPSSPECEISECKDCWNREIPIDKTEESLKILEAHKKAYEQGLNDAWEFIFNKTGNMTLSEFNEIFDCAWARMGDEYTPQEAIAKLKAYEDSKIEVGDVVLMHRQEAVVTRIVDQHANILFGDGVTNNVPVKDLVGNKTGKHIDIKSILEQIGE